MEGRGKGFIGDWVVYCFEEELRYFSGGCKNGCIVKMPQKQVDGAIVPHNLLIEEYEDMVVLKKSFSTPTQQ